MRHTKTPGMDAFVRRGPAASLVGAAWRVGAPVGGAELGPDALIQAGAVGGLPVGAVIRLEADYGDPAVAVSRLAHRLATAVTDVAAAGRLPIVVGGDHSSAIGTWRGVKRASRGPIGLVWIDAHLDCHLPATTPSGALHGMPLAVLLGHGDPRLTNDAMMFSPEHVAVVGARSFEPDEAALLTSLGVRVFPHVEVERRGLMAVLHDAYAIAQTGTVGFGISIDLDAIDPRDAPGVSTPVAGGLRAAEVVAALRTLERGVPLVGLEIAELNPLNDAYGRTVALAGELIHAVLEESTRDGAAEARRLMAMEAMHGAHNYSPLPVVLHRGSGVHLWDVAGRKYLDMMSAYSAVSLGHGHPRILATLNSQAATLAVTSRAFYNDRLPPLLKRLCELTGMDEVLPANTGLEAVETALKAARKWAYKVKGVAADQAEIIACHGNFHGRSIAIVGMSSEPQYRDGFGPFPPGLRRIPYGDPAALEAAITAQTAAFLVEPVQGEGGIIVPPAGYLAECARICRERNVLLICDEVQTGLGRTGRILACEHENVVPDGVILGKALGGGVLPISAFVAKRHVTQVFAPGDHGSTFGGNPLAAAVALEALDVIVSERLAARAAELGSYFLERLRAIDSPLIREVRGLGLLIGVDLDPARTNARIVCERMLERGVLSKDTHGTVVRFAPPLVATRADIDQAVATLASVLAALESKVALPA